jgi:LmbE family N-acetylglucosaminyl deacetylase
MMLFVMVLIVVISLLWLIGFLWVNDFAVPLRDAPTFHRVLAIFPHGDDEVMTCGGLLHHLARKGCSVTLVLLTKGERGTPDASLDVKLKDIRTQEAIAAARILHISTLIQEDIGDGTLAAKKQELADTIETIIKRESPDLLITYDRAGFYGHADHIACSEVVTQLKMQHFPLITLWYATFPKTILKRVKLPEHMAATPSAQERQAFPTQRIFIGASVFPKIKAWYVYKSQRSSLTNGLRRPLPFWFFLSMLLFEYMAEAEGMET